MGKGLLAVLVLLIAPRAVADAIDPPRVNDPRLALSLVASDPDVVTPVGLAIDSGGRLFVLESHTHSPPRNYGGPKSDQIKVFSPPGPDGRCRSRGVYADGIEDGMGLAFSPAGDLFVVTSQSVLRLADRDADGVAESRSKVLELLTPQRPYEHAALLGVAIAGNDWVYVSRGNVGSMRHTLRCPGDGSSVGGYGDGGEVVRFRPDGTGLDAVATGFWNPFGLAFDAAGRLFCVDNDPDARGPNRLVHVIPGGDYGYKSMYGGGGNHPFQAWNGELPGTLPFVAGLGEAPCGVLDASRAALPDDYRDTLLCTVWGEHNITRARLKPRGASFAADTDLLVEGGQDFRPVAIAADPGGAVYFTDWVKRDYPNHGHGRLWRLAAREGVEPAKPRAEFAAAAGGDSPRARPVHELLAAVADADPFLRSAAIAALAAPEHRSAVVGLTEHPDPEVRVGALLALRRAGGLDQTLVRRALGDAHPRVRQVALMGAAEGSMTVLLPELNAAVTGPGTSAEVFEVYLAATECLSPEFVRALREGREPYANRLPRRLDPRLIASIVRDAAAPAPTRALALTRLHPPDDVRNLPALRSLIHGTDPLLQLEAARTLAGARTAGGLDLLREAAFDTALPSDVRAEAILALSTQPPADAAATLLPLLGDADLAVRVEVVRALQGATSVERVVRALRERLEGVAKHGADHEPRFTEQLRFALSPAGDAARGAAVGAARPATPAAWRAAVAEGGDPTAGRRVFYSPRVGCAGCHIVHNRGGRLGPDLSRAGATRDRARLIDEILRPSDEFSIDYQAWYVKTRDGDTHLGLQLDLKDRGDIELFTTQGKTVHFPGGEIVAYGASKKSLMPDGLEAGMSVSDVRDLIAYLESLR